MSAGFTPIEHTADVGLEVWGKTLEELFGAAACGMFSFFTSLEDIKPSKSKNVVVKSNDLEELLVDWLNELNYLFETEKFVFNTFKITIDKSKFTLKAKCTGEKIDLSKREVMTEIKAATFSDLQIKRQNNLYKTTVIFDV
ncbi:MAG: archease [bacterium]